MIKRKEPSVYGPSKRSTVKAAKRKFMSFMSFENITFKYWAFQV